jgi:hypothetical protein
LDQIVPNLDKISSQEDLDKVLSDVLKKIDTAFTPMLSYWSSNEEMVPITIFNLLEVTMENHPIYKQGTTAVYNLKEYDYLVIKYYTYCYKTAEKFDPVATEATFMKLLQPLNISPKVVYVSAPTIVPIPAFRNQSSGKVQQTTCDEYDGSGQYDGSIRYMIMEKVGESLYSIMLKSKGGRIPFRQAIKYGIKMIELLKKLHSHNIIHGDAHLGNLATRLDNPNELMLIDFGRAEYVGPTEIANARGATDFCTNTDQFHPFYGKWEIKNCKPAFRDDVYRAVEMTAVIMHGQSHLNFFNTLPGNNKAVYGDLKNSANFFNIPNKSTIGKVKVPQGLSIRTVTGITNEFKRQLIQSHLDHISALAVYEDPQNPYHIPNHDLIIEKFENILKIL